MAELNANAAYFTLDGVDVQPYLQSISLDGRGETVDSTTGTATHRARQAGLRSYNLNFSLVYRVGSVQNYIQKLKPNAEVAAVYGPEGSGTGKPKHSQKFIITGNTRSQDRDAKLVVFEVTAESSAAPTDDMDAGATF